MSEEIRLYFVIPKLETKESCSKELKHAFSCSEKYRSGMVRKWIREEDCYGMDNLMKQDVFVLEEFSGPLFIKLRGTKCLIVGARCLSSCLTEGTQIPAGTEPVFNVAMRGFIITCSGFSKAQKEKLKEKIQWMGGTYSNVLTEETTHLISDTVLSDKYYKSSEKGIPIIHSSWLAAVWEASLAEDVSNNSDQFLAHKLPIFANLSITTSGIGKRDKQKIMKLVNENGGTFSGSFQSETTDVLIITKEGIGSEKYKAAVEYGKVCVLPEWVFASVSRGSAQPTQLHKVSGASTSSPLSGRSLPNMSLDFSTIADVRKPVRNFVNETADTDLTAIALNKKSDDEVKVAAEIGTAIDSLSLSDIKKAGSIFDGYCVYLCGIEGNRRERLAMCVSRAGCLRYDAPHERVTHILAGNEAAARVAARSMAGAKLLSVRWLVDSIKAAQVLETSLYEFDSESSGDKENKRRKNGTTGSESASPMSKRNLQLLRPSVRPPVPLFQLDVPAPEEDNILEQYRNSSKMTDTDELMQNIDIGENGKAAVGAAPEDNTKRTSNGKPATTEQSTVEAEPSEEVDPIFNDIRMELQGLDEETAQEMVQEISHAGGEVVDRGGAYVIVPLDYDEKDVNNPYAQIVTVFWLRDCLMQQELLPVEYYHRPVKYREPESGQPAILDGVVLSISTYVGQERLFLDEFARLLGAITQLRFCRCNTATARASTHLLCPEPTGDKYAGALKWGLPAINSNWLLDCAEQGRRVSERPYLVGDTKVPERSEPPMQTESPQETNSKSSNKENTDTPDAPTPQASVAPQRGNSSNEGTPVALGQRGAAKGAGGSSESTPTPSRRVGQGIALGTCDGDMSPASRYIAMARQGLLAVDTQETPKRVAQLKVRESAAQEQLIQTPPLDDALSTPNLATFSPRSRRRMLAIRRGDMPSGPPKTPINPFEMKTATPDSPFGAALRPGTGQMSAESRKMLWNICQDLPQAQPNRLNVKKDTPLSEICNRFLAKYNPKDIDQAAKKRLDYTDDTETPPQKILKLSTDKFSPQKQQEEQGSSDMSSGVDTQLQQLDSVLAGGSGSRSRRATNNMLQSHHELDKLDAAVKTSCGPDSQAHTVGWDDTSELRFVSSHVENQQFTRPPPPRKFMLSSNVDNKEEICAMIVRLGGLVSDAPELDDSATHLLCSQPSRSARILGSVAAGKWCLHPVYVVRSNEKDEFLDESLYEWGNPAAAPHLPTLNHSESLLAGAAYRWRLMARASPPYRSFRVTLHVQEARRVQLSRLVEAGGGTVVNDSSPYSCRDATLCLVDMRRYPLNKTDLKFFVENGIPVCQPVYISNYLVEDPSPSPTSQLIPEYQALVDH